MSIFRSNSRVKRLKRPRCSCLTLYMCDVSEIPLRLPRQPPWRAQTLPPGTGFWTGDRHRTALYTNGPVSHTHRERGVQCQPSLPYPGVANITASAKPLTCSRRPAAGRSASVSVSQPPLTLFPLISATLLSNLTISSRLQIHSSLCWPGHTSHALLYTFHALL